MKRMRGFSIAELLIVIVVGWIVVIVSVWATQQLWKPRPTNKAHWVDAPYWPSSEDRGVHDSYRCDNNGKSIAEVSCGFACPSSGYDVYGGDGGTYGNYPTIEAAKRKAEQIASINANGLGSNHNFCDEEMGKK